MPTWLFIPLVPIRVVWLSNFPRDIKNDEAMGRIIWTAGITLYNIMDIYNIELVIVTFIPYHL